MKWILNYMDDVLFALGIVLVSIGVFQIYIPAGYITSGICFITCAYFYAKRR